MLLFHSTGITAYPITFYAQLDTQYLFFLFFSLSDFLSNKPGLNLAYFLIIKKKKVYLYWTDVP